MVGGLGGYRGDGLVVGGGWGGFPTGGGGWSSGMAVAEGAGPGAGAAVLAVVAASGSWWEQMDPGRWFRHVVSGPWSIRRA